MKQLLAIAVTLLSVSAAASSVGEKPLRGVYAIEDGPLDVDPDPKDVRKRLYLKLYGDSAKEMYKAMVGPVDKETCGIDGLRLKQTKNLVCMTTDSTSYECVFVINAVSGEMENGFAC